MRRIIALSFFALVGCASISTGGTKASLPKAIANCNVPAVPFTDFGVCLRQELEVADPNWTTALNGDIASVYVSRAEAYGDAIKAGTMTESQAKASLNSLWLQIESVTSQREAVASAQNSARMRAAAALLQASGPSPVPVTFGQALGSALQQAYGTPEPAPAPAPRTHTYIINGQRITCTDQTTTYLPGTPFSTSDVTTQCN